MPATSTVLSEFDHFKLQAVQNMVVHEYDAPIAPLAAPKMGQMLEFLIAAVEGLYRDLSDTFSNSRSSLPRMIRRKRLLRTLLRP
jgi:hypothetical protein